MFFYINREAFLVKRDGMPWCFFPPFDSGPWCLICWGGHIPNYTYIHMYVCICMYVYMYIYMYIVTWLDLTFGVNDSSCLWSCTTAARPSLWWTVISCPWLDLSPVLAYRHLYMRMTWSPKWNANLRLVKDSSEIIQWTNYILFCFIEIIVVYFLHGNIPSPSILLLV